MATTEAHRFRPQDSHPSCPFCPYVARSHGESDMYMLLQHLELSHPENGESPFIAREASPLGQRERSQSSASSRSATRRGSRSRSLTPTDQRYEEDVYVDCPLKCGEAVHIRELEDHMELHDIEGQGLDEAEHANSATKNSPVQYRRKKFNGVESLSRTAGAEEHLSSRRSGELLTVPEVPGSRGHRDSSPLHHSLKEFFLGPAPRKTRQTESKSKSGGVHRLGRAELGPHAFEEQMPSWLFKQLEQGSKVSRKNVIGPGGKILQMEVVANETPAVIPVLAQLCAQDPAVSKVFLCHPSVKHIFKTPREGGFCGYRNIQMVVSFLQGYNYPGWENFPGPTPSIPRLQDMIEAAWDRGFHSSSRIETGGIRGTRKYIGTPEAQALFGSLGIGCEANAFRKSKSPTKPYVHDHVVEAVLEYFSSAGVADPSQKVFQTALPPIYFQHPGHSLCIVGVEIRKSGNMNLLVFDPMFKTAPGIAGLVGTTFHCSRPETLLQAFRRGNYYMGKYHSFEILKLTAPSLSQQRLPHTSSSEQTH